MSNFFPIIKNILTYKKQNNDDFEFLEEHYENGNPKTENRDELESTISSSLKENIERMNIEFNLPTNTDIIIREFKVANKLSAFIIYIDGMVDKNITNDFILKPLMSLEDLTIPKSDTTINYIFNTVLYINQISNEKKYENIIEKVLNGNTVLFIDKSEECLVIDNIAYEKRAVNEPITEKVIMGSHEAFTESLKTNVSLIRKIIKNKNLITEMYVVDKTNKTDCALLYLNGVANPTIINEVKRRIQNLNIDYISGSGMLEELLSDYTFTPFPLISTTERPDRTASFIMDGKVVLIINGTPFASAMPATFFEAIRSSEDYSLKWQFATFSRYIRLIALVITLLLPGFYAAITLYHQEMIPTELLYAIVKAKENVPFPTIFEILLIEIAFELIREAGIRVPGSLGNTIGIVGALVIGQSAVQAQLVSPILVIIVALSGISSFVIPSYSIAFTIRLLRFAFIIAGSLGGFYGISILLVIVLAFATNVKSFGVPYFAPIAPKTNANPDVLNSLSASTQKIRPDFLNPLNKYRAGKITKEWTIGKDDDNT